MSTTTLADVVPSARWQHTVPYTSSAHSAAPAAGCGIVPAAWAGWCPLAAPRGSQRCHPSAPCCSRHHTAESRAAHSARVAARGVHGADNGAPLSLKWCDTGLVASAADNTPIPSSCAIRSVFPARAIAASALWGWNTASGVQRGLPVGLVVRAHSITCSTKVSAARASNANKFPCRSSTILLSHS